MSVHQVRWNADKRNILHFNSLSCFECLQKCEHFFLCEKEYDAKINDSQIQIQREGELYFK